METKLEKLKMENLIMLLVVGIAMLAATFVYTYKRVNVTNVMVDKTENKAYYNYKVEDYFGNVERIGFDGVDLNTVATYDENVIKQYIEMEAAKH